ncbi:hypothetical protein ACFWXO_05095 [Kitasatospora sp. NPDC059088]|uniref:hypothetical protein n=1 Tax=Kitasatospora sp. NPDC059088 TaxID=3346722 RepID=UPI0036CA4620
MSTSPQPPFPNTLAVGQPYSPHITRWRDGTAELRLTAQGAQFVLAVSKPAKHEIKAFAKGNAEFAVVNGDHVTLLLYKFTDPFDSNPKHGLPWSDAPWEYHRQAQLAPADLPTSGVPLYLALVDADTGITQALRLIGLPAEFSAALREGIVRQKAHPMDNNAATAEINRFYQQAPSDLVLTADSRFEALRDGTADTTQLTLGPASDEDAEGQVKSPADGKADAALRLAAPYGTPRPYPGVLPADLIPWHTWIADCGHSVVVAMAEELAKHPDKPDYFLIPASPQTVMRLGYTWVDGYPAVSGLNYDPELGLITPDDEYEF